MLNRNVGSAVRAERGMLVVPTMGARSRSGPCASVCDAVCWASERALAVLVNGYQIGTHDRQHCIIVCEKTLTHTRSVCVLHSEKKEFTVNIHRVYVMNSFIFTQYFFCILLYSLPMFASDKQSSKSDRERGERRRGGGRRQESDGDRRQRQKLCQS